LDSYHYICSIVFFLRLCYKNFNISPKDQQIGLDEINFIGEDKYIQLWQVKKRTQQELNENAYDNYEAQYAQFKIP